MRNAARIGRVRMKGGGADVRVLQSKNHIRRREIVRALRAAADQLCGYELDGFALVAWSPDGSTHSAWDSVEGGPNYVTVPDYVAGVLRARGSVSD